MSNLSRPPFSLGPERPAVGVAWRDRPFLSVAEAASLLGYSRAKLYARVKAGEFPPFARMPGCARVNVPTRAVLAELEAATAHVPDGSDPRGRALSRRRAAEARSAADADASYYDA